MEYRARFKTRLYSTFQMLGILLVSLLLQVFTIVIHIVISPFLLMSNKVFSPYIKYFLILNGKTYDKTKSKE